jgi:hypothetical protein
LATSDGINTLGDLVESSAVRKSLGVLGNFLNAERYPYRVYLVAFAAMATVFAWPFLFNGLAFAFSDIGTDTFVQFFPLNVAHAQQLAGDEGLTWSFKLGLGGYIGTHFDPFWMLQGLIPESMQLHARIYTYLLKLGLAGLFFACYLRTIGLRGSLVVLGGLAYAFSEYALVNGQWDLHGTELVHFAILLCLLEKYIRSGQLVFPLLIGLLLGAGHSFNLYTSAFFSLLYILARAAVTPPHWTARTWIDRLALLGGGVVLGILILAPLQFPALLSFLDSPRVTGDHVGIGRIVRSVFSVNDWATIVSTLLGFLGKGMQGVGNAYGGWGNYLEGPGFFVGLPFLLFSTQLAGRNAAPAERRLFWIAVLGVALYVIFPAIRYAVFGFNHIAFRVSTLWISMLILTIGLLGLRRQLLSGLSILPFCLTALGMIALMLVSPVLAAGKVELTYVLASLALLATYAIVVIFDRLIGTRAAIVVLMGVFAVELFVLARPALVDREIVSLDGSSRAGSYQDGTSDALRWIESRHAPSDFYRVEKDYFSVFLLDSLVQGYRGIRSYYFHGTGITRFIDSIGWPRTVKHSNYIESDLSRGDVLDMLGVKYVLSRTRNRDSDPDIRHLATVAGIEIYERINARGVAVLHSHVVGEAEAGTLGWQERDALMLDSVIVAEPSTLPGSLSVSDGAAVSPTQVEIALETDTRLSGHYSSGEVGMLAFAIPFSSGWHLLMDDDTSSVPLERVNYGLLGAIVPAGTHTFELRFRTPGRWLGYRVAPAAVAITFLIFYLQRRRNRVERRLPAC